MNSYSEFRITRAPSSTTGAISSWRDFEDLRELIHVDSIRSEYLAEEIRFVQAMAGLFAAAGADHIDLCNVEPPYESRENALRALAMHVPIVVPIPPSAPITKLGTIVQALFRSQFWCILAAPGIEMCVHEDMIVSVRCAIDERLFKPLIAAEGLLCESAEYPHEYFAFTQPLLDALSAALARSPIPLGVVAELVREVYPLADSDAVRATCILIAEQMTARKIVRPATIDSTTSRLEFWPEITVEPWPGVVPETAPADDQSTSGKIDFAEFSTRLERVWPERSHPNATFRLVQS